MNWSINIKQCWNYDTCHYIVPGCCFQQAEDFVFFNVTVVNKFEGRMWDLCAQHTLSDILKWIGLIEIPKSMLAEATYIPSPANLY